MRHITNLLLVGLSSLVAIACGDVGRPPHVSTGELAASLDAGVPEMTASEARFEGLGSAELASATPDEQGPYGICAQGRPAGFERCASGQDEDCDGLVDADDPDCGVLGEPEPGACDEVGATLNLEALPLDACVDAMLQARTACHAMPGCVLSATVSIDPHGANGIAGTEACSGNGNFGIQAWRCAADIATGDQPL